MWRIRVVRQERFLLGYRCKNLGKLYRYLDINLPLFQSPYVFVLGILFVAYMFEKLKWFAYCLSWKMRKMEQKLDTVEAQQKTTLAE